MKTKIKELGEIITDTVTDQKGMLTTITFGMDLSRNYVFQPSLINPEDGKPVERYWINEKRIQGEDIEVDLPLDILGTIVEDKATGFKGTAISLDYYINGCIHVDVKPKGVLEKTNKSVEAINFDLRRLKGEKIQEMTKEERKKSEKDKPSPEYKPDLKYK